jgi:hypothetical protein
MNVPSIAWSKFSRDKEKWKFNSDSDVLIALVRNNWKDRLPGVGRKDLKQVVVVPIDNNHLGLFNCNWIPVYCAKRITGKITKRQPFEDPFVALKGSAGKFDAMPVLHAKIVLYSAATLLEDNGKRSSNADWEIVAILTGPWENEPMTPLTMARNMLRKPGGTYVKYTAQQFAESIYFWSAYIQQR